MKTLSPVTPTAFFSQLYPPRTVFMPRTNLHHVRWVYEDDYRLDASTGITLTAMGNMPLICHQNAATASIMKFLRQTGLEPSSNITTYETEAEAVAIARHHIRQGEKLAYFYPPPSALESSDGLVVPVPLYNRLNDKANLAHLADIKFLPRHRMVATNDLFQLLDFLPGEKVFIKACNPGASGFGKDVLYCPDTESRVKALKWIETRLEGLSGIRIEEEVAVGSCWCLSMAVLESGVRYLGAATQLFSEPAKQCGSRIDPDDLPSDPVVSIAMAVAERARKMGFRGVAGFDIGVNTHGQPYVFDLNFRVAGSTMQVLLHESAVRRTGAKISQSWRRMVKGTLAPALESISDFARRGQFLPFSLFEMTPATGGKSIIAGMVVAATLDEIESITVGMENALRNFL